MAVFMLNVCKFNSCGLKFQSLGHLIQHIEETHIDYDPHVVERTEQQQPACIPLSYVLRFLTDNTRREINSSSSSNGNGNSSGKPQQVAPSNAQQQQQQPQQQPQQQQQQQPARPASQSSTSSSASTTATTTTNNQRACKSLTPTGSEAEEGEDFLSEPEDSNDSWTTLEEFSQDFILRYGSRNTTQNTANQSVKDYKPFACPVPGCKKRYKNINGIKYHSKNGHKNDGKVRKAFKCHCGKSYKTSYGLKNHTSIRHSSNVAFKYSQAVRQTMDNQLDEQQQQQQRYVRQQQFSKSNLPKIPKIKVPAIQDHGYMKQEQYSGEADSEYEMSSLGILTPAASPPLPSPVREQPQFHNKYHLANTVNSSQTHVRPCDN